jgi:hypothetical protein
MRCDTLGTSGHVTTKSSIRNWGVLYKSGVYARKVIRLTPGGLLCATRWLSVERSALTAGEKSAEGKVSADREAEKARTVERTSKPGEETGYGTRKAAFAAPGDGG